MVLTTSADKTARVWKLQGEDGGYASAAILNDHAGEVTAAAVHVTNDYFITASLDKTWAFYDVATATCLHQVWACRQTVQASKEMGIHNHEGA